MAENDWITLKYGEVVQMVYRPRLFKALVPTENLDSVLKLLWCVNANHMLHTEVGCLLCMSIEIEKIAEPRDAYECKILLYERQGCNWNAVTDIFGRLYFEKQLYAYKEFKGWTGELEEVDLGTRIRTAVYDMQTLLETEAT